MVNLESLRNISNSSKHKHMLIYKSRVDRNCQRYDYLKEFKNSSDAVNKISMLTNTARFAPIRHEDNVKHLLASELDLEGT